MSEPFQHKAVPATSVFQRDIFKDKVALVTGGGSGICYAITETLMRFGAKAAIVGRKADRLSAAAKSLSEATGSEAIALSGDVRDFDTMQRIVNDTVAKWGRLDFVVCGAAGNFMAPLQGLSSRAFRAVVEIDLIGTYNTVRASMDALKKSHGTYLHISATLHYSGLPWQAAPSAAKAGVDVLSNVIAVELGPFGVRSNCIAPGLILGTEGASRLVPEGGEDAVGSMIPLQRAGQKDDIANAAVFLFSDAANWISGQVIVCALTHARRSMAATCTSAGRGCRTRTARSTRRRSRVCSRICVCRYVLMRRQVLLERGHKLRLASVPRQPKVLARLLQLGHQKLRQRCHVRGPGCLRGAAAAVAPLWRRQSASCPARRRAHGGRRLDSRASRGWRRASAASVARPTCSISS